MTVRPLTPANFQREWERPGFSLLEVMLAVVILGLGILGISAFFAGAARQQQTSSEVQRSVAIGLNAKASLNRKLGSIIGLNPGDLPDRQWRWIRFFDDDLTGFEPSPTLDIRTILPNANPNDQRPFFRVEAPGVELYVNQSPDLFSVAGQGNYNAGSDTPPFGILPPFPHGLIIPGSLAFEVVVENTTGVPGATPPVILNPVSPPPEENDLNPNDTYEYTNGSAFIRVVFNPVGGGGAFIESFDLTPLFGGDPNLYIASIRALPYAWKNHKLLSLNERLRYVEDGRFPPAGLRPEGGFVLFYRRVDEISEALVLTYSLLPQSRPRLNDNQFPLITPEFGDNLDNPNATSLIRERRAQIRWDNNREQYYIRVQNNPQNSWIAASGQLLLMKECLSCPVNTERGADNIVRVISQVVDPDVPNSIRGYLDDVPRVNLTAVVPQRESDVESVIFYGLFPEIINADPADDTRWKVRPVDARLIPIILR